MALTLAIEISEHLTPTPARSHIHCALQDGAMIGQACVNYDGSEKKVRELARANAVETLKSYATTAADDKKLLESGSMSERESMSVRYRLAIKEILQKVGEGKEATEQSEEPPHLTAKTLEEKVADFNAFIDSLNFPTNYLTAYVAGDGMRVGTKANRDITFGESYIDVPVTAVMSAANAKTSNDEVNKLIQRGRQLKDDLHTVLFFLLHERFVERENSYWWPYLALLPTLDEYREYHPSFFSQNKLEGLAGSGVRQLILDNQNRAKTQFKSASKDSAVTGAFGDVWTETNYLWAMTILDSRSIWWNGSRNLVPLLDLINCKEGPPGSTIHSTRLDESGKNAVTLAPWDFKEGEQVFEK